MPSVNWNREAANAVQALRLMSHEARQVDMRIMTGLSVASPRDNGAVFAIAEGKRSRLASYAAIAEGMARAKSLIDVTLGAGMAVSDILLRMKAVAGAARSNDLTPDQRAALQADYDALRAQIDRIAASSQFNGANLSAAGGSDIDVTVSDQASAGAVQQIRTANTLVQLGAPVRISTDAAGQQASGSSASAVFMPDSRSVIFQSQASDLVPGDTNGVRDIFLKDIVTGAITRISTSAAGGQQTGASDGGTVSISADGRFVMFSSQGSNLVAGDTNSVGDVFIRDQTSGSVIRISTNASGAQGDGASAQGAFSVDGRQLIVFQSFATNLVPGDTNGQSDVFLKDLETGAIARVSTTAAGDEATGHSYKPLLSPDGQTVLFESLAANLVPGDTNGASDVFLKNLQTGAITRLSANASGGSSQEASFSPDGRYVAFHSTAPDLVPGDTNAAADIFLRDLVTGAMQRVSTDAAGGQQNASAHTFTPAFSPDGRFVTFASNASNLTPGDTNGQADSFLKDLKTGAVTLLSTTAAGGQATGGSSYVARFSPDGRYVVFRSGATNLVAGDTNGQDDIFLREVSLTSTGIVPGLAAYVVGTNGVTAGDDTQLRIDGVVIGTVDITAGMTISDYLEAVRTVTAGRVSASYDTVSGEFTYETAAISGGQGALSITSAGTARTWLGHGLSGTNQTSGRPSVITLRDQDWSVGGGGALAGISSAAGQLLTADGARMADEAIDQALVGLSQEMSLLGAKSRAIETQERFNTAFVAVMEAAVSRLVDADLPHESARLQSLQIKQQLASKALSIANQTPQILLSLFARPAR